MVTKFKVPDFDARQVPPEAIEQLAAPVGRIITAWSYVDQNIDIWVREGLHLDPERGEVPRNFDSKLEYLKRLNKRLKVGAEAENVARSIISRVRIVARVRHALAHWTLTHFFREGEGAAVFTKMTLHPDGDVSAEDVTYTLQELRDHLDEIILMAGTLQAITGHLSRQRQS